MSARKRRARKTGREEAEGELTARSRDGNAVAARVGAGGDFVTKLRENTGRRTDPDEARSLYSRRKHVGFAEHAVAGVHCGAALLPRGAQQRVSVEVGGHAGAAERVRGVAAAHVERVSIVDCVDCDGGDAEELQGARHTDCDFTAVGDEHFVSGRGCVGISSRAC
jgi:hypothetical protein